MSNKISVYHRKGVSRLSVTSQEKKNTQQFFKIAHIVTKDQKLYSFRISQKIIELSNFFLNIKTEILRNI